LPKSQISEVACYCVKWALNSGDSFLHALSVIMTPWTANDVHYRPTCDINHESWLDSGQRRLPDSSLVLLCFLRRRQQFAFWRLCRWRPCSKLVFAVGRVGDGARVGAPSSATNVGGPCTTFTFSDRDNWPLAALSYGVKMTGLCVMKRP